jgi:hypothetical protein
MGKVSTNFIEIILRTLIGKTIYLDDDVTPIVIDDLNYEPKIRQVYIHSGTDSYKLSLDKIFEIDDGVRTKRQPNKRIVGKKKRNW